MLSNLPALKIVSTLTMCISSQRRFMGSSKPQEHGMNSCEISLSLMASKSKKSILLSLLKLLQKICLYAKFWGLICYSFWSNMDGRLISTDPEGSYAISLGRRGYWCDQVVRSWSCGYNTCAPWPTDPKSTTLIKRVPFLTGTYCWP
jgi:hypothetical protein